MDHRGRVYYRGSVDYGGGARRGRVRRRLRVVHDGVETTVRKEDIIQVQAISSPRNQIAYLQYSIHFTHSVKLILRVNCALLS